jgi:rod shape-determining protein MreB
VGGNKFDEAITDYLRRECSILVGKQTAESIKKDLAAALPLEESRSILVRGINQLNTSASTVQFSSAQAYQAVKNPCSAIIKAIRWVLERTPPELAADIMRGGIHLTGDGARLFALDRFISESLGIPVLLARDPGDCCILGIGYLTENMQLVSTQDKPASGKQK